MLSITDLFILAAQYHGYPGCHGYHGMNRLLHFFMPNKRRSELGTDFAIYTTAEIDTTLFSRFPSSG